MIVQKLGELKAHSAALYGLCLRADQMIVYSGGSDKVVAQWDMSSSNPEPFAIRTEATIYSLVEIGSRVLIIGTIAGGIHVIDLIERKEVRHLKLHDEGIFHLEYDRFQNRLYASSGDGSLSVWNVEDWSLLWHLQLSSKKIRRTILNHNGTKLAVALGDGHVTTLETDNHEILHSFKAHEDATNSIAFMKDGTLLSGGKDAYLKRWKVDGNPELVKAIPAHNYAIYDIINREDQGWIATASRDKTIKIWDNELKDKPLRVDRSKYHGHMNSVNRLVAWKDGVISCSDDRSIMKWKIQN